MTTRLAWSIFQFPEGPFSRVPQKRPPLPASKDLPPPPSLISRPKVFIVHGRDLTLRAEIALFLERGGVEPIILGERSRAGQTLIDELVKQSKTAQFAVILATADDEGRLKGASELHSRARQNVVLELGYFLGKLGQGKVAVLADGSIEHPSDYQGVIRILLRDGDDWKVPLAKAIKRNLPTFNQQKAVGL